MRILTIPIPGDQLEITQRYLIITIGILVLPKFLFEKKNHKKVVIFFDKKFDSSYRCGNLD